ncbi:hypothetical protein [Corallincola spongiicola]|uniref:Uncharacterized protein n=1 Tax=Corallincola spongiicola TaxID=2520508 RepID=A0ABY1WSD4_9GAMM|nr:hypothetical protein [Corallincola spongiicola]TAA47609.1 hypothetical protein EXY25_10370 [Corallincola spongiicola]
MKYLICLIGWLVLTPIVGQYHPAVANGMYDLLILVLGGLLAFLGYFLFKLGPTDTTHQSLSVGLSRTLGMVLLACCVVTIIASAQLAIAKPFALVCRYNPCDIGPHAWSTAIFAMAASPCLLQLSYRMVIRRK